MLLDYNLDLILLALFQNLVQVRLTTSKTRLDI